ncbi:hypothetical protein PARPLA_00874 [Rhodobacteraceae bacterium THAF1]|uniref:hypothetical protein n=1 Tax=Palleronia sp. THAF1 TaxID=2587842 RepID=UPI000F3CF6BD|nr:hypothetical protein [Palleronia sp. THAF1]QFU07182.1 hypothetical protein FIU81_00655 [Palleronia sp. THAF1]VDC19971.1 hypothetical protein PARPLA_00874 [Rhodobacteraceae bacterium THAF1]
MEITTPLFDYLTVLAVIQPGRIQDIEQFAPQILPRDDVGESVEHGIFRLAHDEARKLNLVTQVKRGTFFLTPAGREEVRRASLHKEIDNMRLFLMKAQRKRYR